MEIVFSSLFLIVIIVITKSKHWSHETLALSHACNRTLANTSYKPVYTVGNGQQTETTVMQALEIKTDIKYYKFYNSNRKYWVFYLFVFK